MARASCKAPMELLQQQVAGSPFCDWQADIQTGKLCYQYSREPRKSLPKPAARLQWSFCNSKLQDLHFVAGQQISRPASCEMHKAKSQAVPIWQEPAARLQWSFCNSKLQNLHFAYWPADIHTGKLSNIGSRELGSPEILPEPAARLQWSFCSSKLQDLHFVTGQKISRLACYAMYAAKSQAVQKYGQSQLQGSNFCNSKLQDLHVVTGQQISACSGHIYVLPNMLLHISDSLLVWISTIKSQNGDPATCCCNSSIGSLQLALAIFLGSQAFCCIPFIDCWSGYLLASHKMQILQQQVAEAPLEPCSWLWPYFWGPQLFAAYTAQLAGLDICWPVAKWRFCNLLLQKLHWSPAADFGHISGLPSSLLHTRYIAQLACLDICWSVTKCRSCNLKLQKLRWSLAVHWPYFWAAQLFAAYIACLSGYLLACYKMEILQLAVAEAPLEPCSWLSLALAIFLGCLAFCCIHLIAQSRNGDLATCCCRT